jgi:hypothetical protein
LAPLAVPRDEEVWLLWGVESEQPAAEHYNLYYGTTTGAAPTVAAHDGSRLAIPATQFGLAAIEGLAAGSHFRAVVTTTIGAAESTASPVSAEVVASAATTGHTISGSVSCDGDTPTDPARLWIAACEGCPASGENPNALTTTQVAITANPQPCAITGVDGGDYSVVAFIDMDGDGIVEPSDLGDRALDRISVDGADVADVNGTLQVRDLMHSVATSHIAVADNDFYVVRLRIFLGLRLPITAVLSDSPYLAVPIDLMACGSIVVSFSRWGIAPNIDLPYTVEVTLAGETAPSVLSLAPDTVLVETPSIVQPKGDIATTLPDVVWAAPSSAPSDYRYHLALFDATYALVWFLDNIPSATTQRTFNDNGAATVTARNSVLPVPPTSNKGLDPSNGWGETPRGTTTSPTVGWAPSCACADSQPVRCLHGARSVRGLGHHQPGR